MANWYAQLVGQNFNAYHQWNSAANGSGDWLDTAVTDYSNDTFFSNGKIFTISTNLTCAKLVCDNNFFRFSGTGLVIHADIENNTQYSSIDIQPNSDVTIFGDLIANGTENGAICMYQDNTTLNMYGDIIATGDYSIGVQLTGMTTFANIYNGTLLAEGEYASCVFSAQYNDIANLYINNCTLIGGTGFDANAIRLEDGSCIIENSTLIAGSGSFCEAVKSMAFPAILNGCNMISSEWSMPVTGSMIYTPNPDNYWEIWGNPNPSILALIPDAANLRKGVVCGNVTGTLAPASPFRRLNRFV
jgi:hypothetical protein